MFSSVPSIVDEYSSISWPIQSIAMLNDLELSEPGHLLLDRANAEFGLVRLTSPGVAAMMSFPDTEEPIFFQASSVRAICTRFNNTCKKVSVLQDFQIDLNFKASADARDFVDKIRRLAFETGNLQFEVHEAVSNTVFARPEFSMEKEGYIEQEHSSWMSVSHDNTSEWARIFETGKCSDFTIVAGEGRFPVHRVLLSTRSQYFNAVCNGSFAETEKRSIELPERYLTVRTMLQELYEVYNPTTGSIFTSFALRCMEEKWAIMDGLFELFIACDKYNLESIKQKAAKTIIDRLPFVHDPLCIVICASTIYDNLYTEVDYGLRNAIIQQLHIRLPEIMEDGEAWKKYLENDVLVKALHSYECEMRGSERSFGMFTPPATPKKK